MYIWTDRQTKKQMNKQMDKGTDNGTYKQTNGQKNEGESIGPLGLQPEVNYQLVIVLLDNFWFQIV